jgi:twinkle protein
VSVFLAADDIDFPAYMAATDAEHKVRPPSHWEEDLVEEFADQGTGNVHPRLPWPRLENKVALRPGEVSLWFGFNGHGKSLLLGQAVLSLCAQDQRCCVASFEMRPRKTLARMARQFADSDALSPREVHDFVAWANGRMWLYDQTSTVEPDKVYAVIRYCVDKLKVQHFVVDNLTKCVAADDDYAGQKQVVDKLTALAQGLGIHIHLVHHARKDRDETRPPRKMDALGASAITNLVDNVFIVWRNKAKYEKQDPDDMQPDAVLICDKQRHGTGWEGLQNLTYHGRSMQYIERGSSAMHMRGYPHTAAAQHANDPRFAAWVAGQ